MSHGRARGFWVPRSTLEQWLDATPCDRMVGILGMTKATASEVKHVLAQQDLQREKIPVEQRDHVDYVVHLGGIDPVHGFDGMSTWLGVGAGSPIHPELRRYHALRAAKKTLGRSSGFGVTVGSSIGTHRRKPQLSS